MNIGLQSKIHNPSWKVEPLRWTGFPAYSKWRSYGGKPTYRTFRKIQNGYKGIGEE